MKICADAQHLIDTYGEFAVRNDLDSPKPGYTVLVVTDTDA